MSNQTKQRLDVLLVERGLFPSREAARRGIMAGLVSANGRVYDKPGMSVEKDLDVHIKRPEHEFVGRGGLKLKRALEVWPVPVDEAVVMDIGASTGGFTDCALQNGAALVYAIDVGYGQLAWKLRQDERVVVMERTNFRHVDPLVFERKPSLAVMDVSFISTKLLLHKISEVLTSPGDVMSLIKPQFEAGRENVGKGGIVRNPLIHYQVLLDMLNTIKDLGWVCKGITFSPISGGDGNIEYLAWWHIPGDEEGASDKDWASEAYTAVLDGWKLLQGEDVSSRLPSR